MPFKSSILVSALAAATVIAARRQPTFLGVVDEQGLLIPIAVLDGETWWNRWPWEANSESISKLPVPNSLASVPADWLPPGLRLPLEWYVLRESGDLTHVRALRIRRPPEPPIMDTFVIQTTYRGRRRIAADELVGISGPGTLRRFVAPAAEEERHVLAQVAQRIDTLEREATERWKGAGGTYQSAVLTRVYRVTTPERTVHVTQRPPDARDFILTKAEQAIDGRTYYYLDGEKLFTIHPHDECMMNLSSSGIVVTNGQGVVVSERIASAAWAEYCGDRASWDTPLATIQVRGETLWVLKSSLEDGYDYVLLSPVTGAAIQLKADRDEPRTDVRMRSARRPVVSTVAQSGPPAFAHACEPEA
jgi:hypothetical protein